MSGFAIQTRVDARAMWLLSVLVVVGAYYAIDAHYQQKIVASREATTSLYSRTVANRRIVAEAARLSAMQRSIDGDLRQLYRKRDQSTTSALLALLQTTAAHYGVVVTGIEPQKGATGLTTAQAASSKSAADTFPDRVLVGEDVVIRARGRFGALLRFVENLPRHDAIVAINQTQLQIAGDAPKSTGSEPSLEATIRGTLYSLRDDREDDSAGD